MSREKNLWQNFGLAIGAGIQDNQLALPCDWDDSLQSFRPPQASAPRKIFWPMRATKTPAFNARQQNESVAA